MNQSQGRIKLLSFDSISFKALHNHPNQLAGEVCLKILNGFRDSWALTPPVKYNLLGHNHFRVLCNSQNIWTCPTFGPAPVSGTGMLPLQRDHHIPVVIVKMSMWYGLIGWGHLLTILQRILNPLNSIYPFSSTNVQIKDCFHCFTDRWTVVQQTEITWPRSQGESMVRVSKINLSPDFHIVSEQSK